MIRQIVDDQRAMVREVIAAKVEKAINPRTTALDLIGRMNRTTGKREGGSIGLTSNQAQWARNAEDQLRALDAAYFSRTLRDKRYDRLIAKAIRDGKPLAQADIDRIVGRYRDRLLEHRGVAIARTESLNALRAGRHEGFRQLVESGSVSEDQIERTWDATGDRRTRFDHAVMDGKKVQGLSQPFRLPDGSMMAYPGDTSMGARAAQVINCRCFEKVRIRYDRTLRG